MHDPLLLRFHNPLIIYCCIFATIFPRYSTQGVMHMSALPDDSFTSEPCQGRKENYCDSRVANSICHQAKDECYCRKGHVFIKEENRDTCKTLLTDLRCGIQGHCIHVNGSICHPGVGYCVCPKGTIYVPQIHECRNRALPGNNEFCSACSEKGGTCYEKAEHEILSTKKAEYMRYGCVCPKSRTSALMKKPGEWGTAANLCNAFLVDVNEFCNEETFFCRSKRAKCVKKGKLSGGKICTCPPKHVAVFQATLRYYECFPELSGDNKGCEGCSEANGKCYDNNGDRKGDGCICSPEKSSGAAISTPHTQPGSKPCQSSHVYIDCSGGVFRICYLPHNDPPYELLSTNLYVGKAVAYVSGAGKTNKECRLRPENGVGVRYCVHISLHSQQSEQCGIRSYRMKHGKYLYLYEGSLVIRVDKNFRTPSQDKVIDLSCYSSDPVPKERAKPTPSTPPTSQTQHKQRHRGNKNFFSDVHVALRILNIHDKEIIWTKAGEPVKLDMVLRDDKQTFKAIMVEDCYANNVSFVNYENGPKYQPLLIVERGCPVAKAGFTATFYPTKTGHTHYQSRLFPAFRLGRASLIFFKCLLRICKDTKWCAQNDCSSGGHTKRDSLPDVRVISRLTYLEVASKDAVMSNTANGADGVNSRINTVNSGGVQRLPGFRHPGLPLRDCGYSACLTTPQIVIISLVLFLLLILVCCLIFVIYRKRQITGRMTRNPGHMTNCMLDEDEGTPLDRDDKCPAGSSTCGGSGSGSGSGGTLPSTLLVTHTGTLDTLQTYSSHFTIDRDRSLMDQSCNSSALLSNSRPDVCTCDHTSDQRSKSMTTSQV